MFAPILDNKSDYTEKPCIPIKIVLEFFVVGIVIVGTEKWELPTFLRLTDEAKD
jgi:hypothetical protein